MKLGLVKIISCYKIGLGSLDCHPINFRDSKWNGRVGERFKPAGC
jgi:hypothetical protein